MDPTVTPSSQGADISVFPYTGIYSSTGLDLIGILSKVINRPDPKASKAVEQLLIADKSWSN